MNVIAYTDGCSLGNPGFAGSGAVLLALKDGQEISRKELTTCAHAPNNVAELMAVRLVVESINKPCTVVVHTDSANVIGWLSKGWKRNNEQVAELVAEIRAETLKRGITLEFVKVDGHAGIELNERAHTLANDAAQAFKAYVLEQ